MRIALTVLFSIFIQIGCATAQSGQHGLAYDFYQEPDYELVDYDYGGLERATSRGNLVAQQSTWWHNGPPGAYLWVKWRDRHDGQFSEHRVMLAHLLPRDMEGKVIVFAVVRGKLVLYLHDNRSNMRLAGCPLGQPSNKCNPIYQQP